MSRRRDSQHLAVVLDVLCPRGHRAGTVVKLVEPHPRAGMYGTAGALRFIDTPDPTEGTGRVRGDCPECGADVQVAWARARAALDDHDNRGRHTGELHT